MCRVVWHVVGVIVALFTTACGFCRAAATPNETLPKLEAIGVAGAILPGLSQGFAALFNKLTTNVEESSLASKFVNCSQLADENLHYSLGDLCTENSFDASLAATLSAYRLTDAHIAATKPPSPYKEGEGVLKFVLASDTKYYLSLRATIASIQTQFPHRHKIVVYDLGGLKDHVEKMEELNNVCNLTVEKFEIEDLPEDVRHLKAFSWKIAIIAKELMKPEERFVYADTSVHFDSPHCERFFVSMSAGEMASIQLGGPTGHTVKFATHLDMYKYLPSMAAEDASAEMAEAGLIFIERSQLSLRVMKWALLCAYTRDCIDPIGAKIYCNSHRERSAQCHRQDQSAFNLLIYNEEKEILRAMNSNGNKCHGRRTNRADRSCFSIQRGQKTDATIANNCGDGIRR